MLLVVLKYASLIKTADALLNLLWLCLLLVRMALVKKMPSKGIGIACRQINVDS